MSDFSEDVDLANANYQLVVDSQIQQIRKSKAESPLPFKGKCYYCDEVLEEGCFCDDDCRDDYEFLKKMERINGKRQNLRFKYC